MATAQTPPGDALPHDRQPVPPKRNHRLWIWASAVLAVVAVGLLVWALSLRSDLDSTKDDNAQLQSQVDDRGGLAATVGAVIGDLTSQLGATSEDLAQTQSDLDDAEQAAGDAAAKAQDSVDQAQSEADQTKAQADAAGSKAKVAAECAKAYVAGFGALFSGEDVASVKKQLQQTTQTCKETLEGA